MFAVTVYDIVLTVHVLAVVVAFGVVFAYPVLDAWFRRAVPATSPRCTGCTSSSAAASSPRR